MSIAIPRPRSWRHSSNGIAFALFLALTSSACGSPMKKPDIKQNPTPKQRYDITLRIDGAPGPFDSVAGSVDYQVSNGRCVPLTPISGATIVPQEHIPLTLTHVSDNVYKGTLYADRFVDEDYYGLGVCQWELVAAGIELKVGKMDFSPSIFLKDIKAGTPVVTYFSKHFYEDSTKPDAPSLTDSGRARREDYKDPTSTFSATLTAEEITP